MTISEAIKRGIDKIRKPHWAFKGDHLQLHLSKGKVNFWMDLISNETADACGDESLRKQTIPFSDDGLDDWEEFNSEPRANHDQAE